MGEEGEGGEEGGGGVGWSQESRRSLYNVVQATLTTTSHLSSSTKQRNFALHANISIFPLQEFQIGQTLFSNI